MQRQKFSAPRLMDFSSKIRHISDSVPCERHGSVVSLPCWWIPSDDGKSYAGICNYRVKKVYNGKITDKSVSNKRPVKEHAA